MKYLIAYFFYEKNISISALQFVRIVNFLQVDSIIIVSTLSANVVEEKIVKKSGISNVTYLPHNNLGWEFGGYQRGLDFIRTKLCAEDILFVCNDTVGIHSLLSNQMLNDFLTGSQKISGSETAGVVGEIDVPIGTSDICIFNISVQFWVRSCLMAFNIPALKALDWRLYEPRLEAGICLNSKNRINLNLVANSQTEIYMNTWLFGGRGNNSWYGASEVLSDEHGIKFVKKAASILNEKLNSGKLKKNGAIFLSIVPTSGFRRLFFRIQRKMHALKFKIRK